MNVKQALTAFVVGAIFGIGLGISGMTMPSKVMGFLDLFGQWDPSLMFVMVGAIGVHAITYRFIRKRESPFLSTKWHVPTSNEITPKLLIGSLIFGLGWGLGGFCPGPAVTSVVSLHARPLLFVGTMIVGMFLYRFWESKTADRG